MRDIRKIVHGLKPALMMLMVQILFASVNVLYKLAINDGMSVRVLTAYRLIFAAATTIPLALIFERKNRPKLTWRVVFMSFFCGLFGGSLFQNLYFESLALISATFASAVYNLIPAVTFILAIFFGFERLNFQTGAGKAKVLGTITGIGGAMMLTFLKGVEINIWTFHINLLHKGKNGTLNDDSGSKLLGVFFGLGSCFCFALWLIIQAKMSKEYQGHYSSTALMSLMGAIQATIFALCVEKDWSQWRLGWSIRLLTAAYSGIVASGLMVIVIAWCVGMRGPLYASVFNPLMLVLVAIAGSLMLDENLYLGRKNRPKLTWRVVFMSFFCGLFGGSLFQNLYFESLALISTTFASAVYNLIPAVTFILVVSFDYERLNFQTGAGKAKVLGTITGIGGAMLLTFLKGVEIKIWTFHINLLHKGKNGTLNDNSGSKLLGVFFGLGSCFCFALWLIIQLKIVK